MAKKSMRGKAASKMPGSVQDLLAIIKERDDSIAELKEEHAQALEDLKKDHEGALKDRQKEHEEELEEVETRNNTVDELRTALDSYGGHQNCLEGAITGRKLHPLCTCGWNHWATIAEEQFWRES
jgi:chromosome segregation ATPase